MVSSTFAFNIEKNDVQSMIKQMKAQGLLSEKQMKDAQKKLSNMDTKDWKNLKDKGREIASEHQSNNPSVSNSVDSAANNIDFDSAQFKDIQSKVKEAMGN